jgi:hypothetical protein
MAEYVDRVAPERAVRFASGRILAQITEQSGEDVERLALIAICKRFADEFANNGRRGLELTARRIVFPAELKHVGDATLEAVQGSHEAYREFSLRALKRIWCGSAWKRGSDSIFMKLRI